MIHLDNAATTRLRPEAREAMLRAPYANPSSIHAAGRAARKALEDAREEIAAAYGGDPKGLVFTSGATEADNLAVFGVAEALAAKGRHLVVSTVEHPAVLEAAEKLEKSGHEVSRAPVGPDGRVDVAAFAKLLRPDTVLACVMAGNNETGALQPVAELAALCRGRGVLLHVDAAQPPGKVPFRFEGDLVTLSAHKMHGPRGIGALWVRPGTPLVPRQLGGGQEFELRAGTENVEGALGFAAAVRHGERDLAEGAARMERLRAKLLAGLEAKAAPLRVHGPARERMPHVLNVAFPGADGEAIVVALDAKGIGVSSGSACASQSLVPSHVLRAMGLTAEETRSSVRFSLALDTTEAEIDAALAAVPGVVARLRALAPAERP